MSGAFAARPDLDDPDLGRLVMRLAAPSIAGLLVTALHQVANAGFVGLIGPGALAAVTVAMPIVAMVAALGHGIGLGAAAAIGRALGAGDADRAGATAAVALALAMVVGLGCGAVLVVGSAPILRLFGVDPAALPDAAPYLSLMGAGCALLLLQITCDFIAIGEGNALFSMWTLLGGFALNIALDPLMIFGFGMGVSGAAIATLLSQVAALSAYAIYFARGWSAMRLSRLQGSPAGAVLGAIVAIGLPTTLGGLLSGLSYGLVYRAADRYGGLDAVAGLGIAFRLYALGTLPLIGFCLGAQAVLSHGFGAGAPGRVLAASRLMLRIALGFSLAYAALMTAAAGPLVGLFTDDAATRRVGTSALVNLQAGFAVSGFELVLLVLLQAKGSAKLAAAVSLAPQGYLLLPMLAVLPPLWGIGGVSAACAGATALTGLGSALMLRSQYGRLRRQATATDPIARLPPARLAGPTVQGYP